MRRLRGFGADPSGSMMVEFALIAPPLLFIILAILQIGHVFLTGLALDNATTVLGRQIRTGEVRNLNLSEFRDAICSQASGLVKCNNDDLWVDARKLSAPRDWPLNEVGAFRQDKAAYDPGAAGDTILVRVFYRYPVWIPMVGTAMTDLPYARRLIASSAAFRNEPSGGTP